MDIKQFILLLGFSVAVIGAAWILGRNLHDRGDLPVMTLEQLRAYDGQSNEAIYISIKGIVYDVSTAASFYGKDGPYHCFAGKESSRALAIASLEEADINGDLTGLSQDDLEDLHSFIENTYETKYKQVALIEPYPWEGKHG